MPELVTLLTVSQSYPPPPADLIDRRHILDQIEDEFSDGISVVYISGDEGTGKTTILQTFAARYPHTAITLFLSAKSMWGYEPTYALADLTSQIMWLTRQATVTPQLDTVETDYKKAIYALRSYLKSSTAQLYFVIDGLTAIPDNDRSVQVSLLKHLPFDLRGVCFLIAGSPRDMPSAPNTLAETREIRALKFTEAEAIAYFDEVGLTDTQSREVNKTCRGIPAKLAAVRRIVRRADSVSACIQNLPSQLPELFEIEWNIQEGACPVTSLALAILAHAPKRYTPHDLSTIVDAVPVDLEVFLSKLSFIEIADDKSVSYVSESFRAFAASKLRDLERRVYTTLVDYFYRTPDSLDALDALPDYLLTLHYYDQILDYFTAERFSMLLTSTKSMPSLLRKAAIGVKAAKQLNKDKELFRFATQSALLRSQENTRTNRTEIEARVALDDIDTALELAHQAIRADDRLHLLCVLARALREAGRNIDDGLREEIRQLVDELDTDSLPASTIDIAVDLVATEPGLAIALVEEYTKNVSNSTVRSLAYANLSLNTLSFKANDSETSSFERISERIEDPALRDFSRRAAVAFRQLSSSEVFEEAAKLAHHRDRIDLLLEWIGANSDAPDAATVAEHALDLLIRATEYTISAGKLAIIAEPLALAPASTATSRLLAKVEAQMPTLGGSNPTVESIRLRLLVTSRFRDEGPGVLATHLLALYCDIRAEEDVGVRSVCMAEVLRLLARLKLSHGDEAAEDLRRMAEVDLVADVDLLLASTANHFEAVLPLLAPLAWANCTVALEVISKLNLGRRRDSARRRYSGFLAALPAHAVDVAACVKVLMSIEGQAERERATEDALVSLAAATLADERTVRPLLTLLSELGKVEDAQRRCKLCSLLLVVLRKNCAHHFYSQEAHLLRLLESSFNAVAVDLARRNTAYLIAHALAPIAGDIARRYLNRAESIDVGGIEDAASVRAYELALRLSIKLYAGLVASGSDTPADLQRLKAQIYQAGHVGEQAGLWTLVACALFESQRRREGENVVQGHILPALEMLKSDDAEYRLEVIAECAPALYDTNDELLSTYLNGIDDDRLDGILAIVFRRRLYSLDPFEPIDASRYKGRKIEFAEALQLCAFLGRFVTDASLYFAVEEFVDALRSKANFESLSVNQRSEIHRHLSDLVNSKLPNPDYINHDGFLIAGLAQLLRLQKSSSEVRAWATLRDRATRIPNISDAAFVCLLIAKAMPGRLVTERSEILAQALDLVVSIPVAIDRIERLEAVAWISADIDKGAFRKAVKSALEMTLALEESVESAEASERVQRRIMDLAHRVDPAFAESLLSMGDQDPARRRARRVMSRQLQRSRGAVTLSDEQDAAELPIKDLSNVCWKYLSLVNTGLATPLKLPRVRALLDRASNGRFDFEFPVFLLAVDCYVKRFAGSDQAGSSLRGLFEASLSTSGFAIGVAQRQQYSAVLAPGASASEAVDSASTFVRAGDRTRAEELIRTWARDVNGERIVVVDPYFQHEHLEMINVIAEEAPGSAIVVLGSLDLQREMNDRGGIEQVYRESWKESVSIHVPSLSFVFVSSESSNRCPVHDRWILGESSGLRLGSSWNGLGKRDSEISTVTSDLTACLLSELDDLLRGSRPFHRNERLLYDRFQL